MIRPPAVAGSFYEGETEQLKKQVERCFKSKIGPGLPGKATDSKFIAGIAPHAGYPYSGPVAAHLYRKIAESGPTETFVILGPNHAGVGAGVSVMTNGSWATPLGQVEIDSILARQIVDGAEIFEDEETAHLQEHSIEVQLPFLQYIEEDFKFVPVCMMMQDPDAAIMVGEAIGAACKNKSVGIIASSDLTHYEPHPVASKKDSSAIDAIEQLDVKKLYETLEAEQISACGYGPIAAAITAAKVLGASKGKLLKYATSGDVTGEKEQVVGYAAIEFL
jgi:AmmeMemoRadiSam system protein B